MDVTSRRRFLTLLAATAAVSACGASDTGEPASGPTTQPPEEPAPNIGDIEPVSHSFERAVPTVNGLDGVSGDRQLAADLYDLIGSDNDDNFILSPYSIATAFSMLLAGANGTTADQIATALGASAQEWHQIRNSLDVAVRSSSVVPEGANPLELDIANTPYGQAGFGFEDEFIRTLAEQYGADLQALDFKTNPEAALELINADVAEATRDRITDLLPPGSIDSLVRLVLVNTVFFKATWITEFDPGATKDLPFSRLDGTVVETPTMQGGIRTSYQRAGNWQMVRLPYWGGYSMTVIVPDGGELADVESQLDETFLAELANVRSDFMVTLALPKFDFKSKADLIPLFQELGVVDVFDRGTADLTGIGPSDDLYVSGAFHQATIEVDEVGTTATAATALVVSATSMPESVTLRIDRPFVFVISHDETGEPLFIGRVTDPSA